MRQWVLSLPRWARFLPRPEAAQADARVPAALGSAQADSLALLHGNHPEAVRIKKQAAYLEGFSLHAGVHLHANDREGLAHLCGYGARPPLAQERLSRLPDGRLAYRLKRPITGRGEVLVLSPSELLRRLAALVPPPRSHLVRYHGVFGPASEWRSQIVPRPPESRTAPCAPASTAQPQSATADRHNFGSAFTGEKREARGRVDPRLPAGRRRRSARPRTKTIQAAVKMAVRLLGHRSGCRSLPVRAIAREYVQQRSDPGPSHADA